MWILCLLIEVLFMVYIYKLYIIDLSKSANFQYFKEKQRKDFYQILKLSFFPYSSQKLSETKQSVWYYL